MRLIIASLWTYGKLLPLLAPVVRFESTARANSTRHAMTTRETYFSDAVGQQTLTDSQRNA